MHHCSTAFHKNEQILDVIVGRKLFCSVWLGCNWRLIEVSISGNKKLLTIYWVLQVGRFEQNLTHKIYCQFPSVLQCHHILLWIYRKQYEALNSFYFQFLTFFR